MGKKSSKRRAHGRAAVKQPVVAAASRPAPTVAEKAPAARAVNLAEEYRYVIGDLRRIGILAASMFVLLVALALLAQYVF